MNKRNIMIFIIFFMFSFSLIGCNLKDDYILETKEDTEEKLSSDKVNEVFESEKMKNLMNKLKFSPKEISDNLNEIDSDTVRIMKEINNKADELTDVIDSADFQGKSEEVKNKLDDISDKLDEIKDNVEDTKNRMDNYENPIDEKQITDTLDEFTIHMNNLEKALDRISSTR